MNSGERCIVYGFFALSMVLFLWRFHTGAADIFLPVVAPGGVAPDAVPAGPDTRFEPVNNYVGLSPGLDDAGAPGPGIYTANVVIGRGAMPAPPAAVK